MIFIDSLTVRFDQSDYKLLVIGQVKSDSFGVTVAKLRAVKNQSVYPQTSLKGPPWMSLYKGFAYLFYLESLGSVHGDHCEIRKSLHC